MIDQLINELSKKEIYSKLEITKLTNILSTASEEDGNDLLLKDKIKKIIEEE